MANTFKQIQVGKLTLSNRLALAPMTRVRASPDHVPTDRMVNYYKQRASYPGSLLISEGVGVTEQSIYDAPIPGIWNQEQIDGWKKVTDAVKSQKSHFVMQLWAKGRSPDMGQTTNHNGKVVGPSAVPTTPDGPIPHALTVDEIEQYVRDHATAAKNAIAAGADGVEIHGANGYLLDSFLSPDSNLRTDKYGGSIENRARFTLQVVDAVVDAIGAEKTALRLSPWHSLQGITWPVSPVSTHAYIVEELERRGVEGKRLAYLHAFDPARSTGKTNSFVREIWSGLLVRCGDFHDGAYRDAELEKDDKMVAAVGRYFLSTPDFVQRVKDGKEFNEPDWPTVYGGDETGYTDYPFST